MIYSSRWAYTGDRQIQFFFFLLKNLSNRTLLLSLIMKINFLIKKK